MDMENIVIMIEKYMKANILMGLKMEKENLYIQRINIMKDYF